MSAVADKVKTYYVKLATEYQQGLGKGRFVLNLENFDLFEENFNRRQKFVLEQYMDESVKSLDRHKLSAIIIIELVRSNVMTLLQERNDADGNIAIDEYVFATLTGMELLRYWLNKKLIRRNIPEIAKWEYPMLLACPDNEYYKVFARNLFFTQKSERTEEYATGFNELELAEKLYLFEYISLISNNIDVQQLQEQHE